MFLDKHPGWTSGVIDYFATDAEYDVTSYTIKVYGNFPHSHDDKADLSSRQRIKVVHQTEPFTSCYLASTDEAIGCRKRFLGYFSVNYSARNLKLINCEFIFLDQFLINFVSIIIYKLYYYFVLGISSAADFTNIVAPKPTTASAGVAKWAGITTLSRKEDTDYKVCWCAGNCHEAYNWQIVYGGFSVPGNGFSWELGESDGSLTTVTRADIVEDRRLYVSRPPFAETGFPKANWDVSLVTKAEYTEHGGCVGAAAGAG